MCCGKVGHTQMPPRPQQSLVRLQLLEQASQDLQGGAGYLLPHSMLAAVQSIYPSSPRHSSAYCSVYVQHNHLDFIWAAACLDIGAI